MIYLRAFTLMIVDNICVWCSGNGPAIDYSGALILLRRLDAVDGVEEWCGCDGEGMAHVPGSESFRCGNKIERGDI